MHFYLKLNGGCRMFRVAEPVASRPQLLWFDWWSPDGSSCSPKLMWGSTCEVRGSCHDQAVLCKNLSLHSAQDRKEAHHPCGIHVVGSLICLNSCRFPNLWNRKAFLTEAYKVMHIHQMNTPMCPFPATLPHAIFEARGHPRVTTLLTSNNKNQFSLLLYFL